MVRARTATERLTPGPRRSRPEPWPDPTPSRQGVASAVEPVEPVEPAESDAVESLVEPLELPAVSDVADSSRVASLEATGACSDDVAIDCSTLVVDCPVETGAESVVVGSSDVVAGGFVVVAGGKFFVSRTGALRDGQGRMAVNAAAR